MKAGTVYQPNEWALFYRVMEHSLASLPASYRSPNLRLQIARRILECAATGERDPIELEFAALADFAEVHRLAG